ncbi:hypothetical protein HZS_3286 [Henneguya salminicola]|nr:hypothetical protein HZS_3286 [Henneguya salminicola]
MPRIITTNLKFSIMSVFKQKFPEAKLTRGYFHDSQTIKQFKCIFYFHAINLALEFIKRQTLSSTKIPHSTLGLHREYLADLFRS